VNGVARMIAKASMAFLQHNMACLHRNPKLEATPTGERTLDQDQRSAREPRAF
jgi:hypothetical protein